MLSRSRGVEALVKLGYSPDDLYVEDIITELLTDFRRALNNPGDGLFFVDVSPAGRMQILDSELMKYCRRVKKDDVLAAKVAIRCLIEDEYILLNTLQKAVKTMIIYVQDGGDSIMINHDRNRILKSLIRYTKKLDEEFTLRASLRKSGQSNARHSDIFLKSIAASVRNKDYVEESENVKERSTFEHRMSSSISVREATRRDFVMEEF